VERAEEAEKAEGRKRQKGRKRQNRSLFAEVSAFWAEKEKRMMRHHPNPEGVAYL